ncbi:MAG: S1 RNA-binding domain-containing protein [Acidobacteriota bacterium]
MARQGDDRQAGSGDGDDFAAMLAEYDQWGEDPEIGQKIRGTIVSIGDAFAFVDLGAKSEGTVDRAELTDENGRLTVAVGDTIEALVSAADSSGNWILRVRAGRGEALRSELRTAFEQKLPVEGVVSSEIKGGLEVSIGGLRAFCPISQIADHYVEDAEEFIDQRFEFRITKYEDSRQRPNIVVSRRVLLQEEKKRRADAVREYLEVGAVLEGTVSSITSYGAFVDLGGLEGLLHASEMGHRRGIDPHEELTEGQTIEVQILKIEPPKKAGQTERIALSTKALERDPWDKAEQRYPKGKAVTGRVMNLETFGAFVELEPGLEGLVHISRLGGKGNASHARQVVELGQSLEVEILSVDTDKKRISLARRMEGDATEDRGEVESYLNREPESSGFGSLADFFKPKHGG